MDPSPAGTGGTRAGRLAGPLVVALVVAVAASVRIGYFALGRGFWRDELSLVQNLDTRGFVGLTRQLGDATTAPPVFLWAVKAGMLAGLTSEPAMRLLPFVAGLAVLPVTAMLARRTGVSWGWAAVPVAALAFVPQIVFYTAQLKPYTLDMLGVTGALVLAHSLARKADLDPAGIGPANRRGRLAYLVLAVVAPWLSLGCMLTIGPITGWLLVMARRSGTTRRWTSWRWLTCLAVTAASTIGAALLAASRNSAVTKFGDSFADWLSPLSQGRGAGLGVNARWFVFLVRDFLRQDLAGPHPLVLGLLLVAGWCCVLRRSRATAVLLAIPAATALVAAVAGGYPFGRRLVLFVVPALVVGLAPLAADVTIGIREVVSRLIPRRRGPATRIAVTGAAVLLLGSTALLTFATPAILTHGLRYQYGIDDYRPSLQRVAAGYQPGDVIVVGVEDRVVARVYGPRLGIPAAAFVMADAAAPGTEQDPTQRAYTSCVVPARVAATDRIWLVNLDRLPIAELPAQEVMRGRLLATFEVASATDTRHVWAALLVRRPARVPTPDTAAAGVCVVYRPIGPVGTAIGDQPLLF